MTVDDAKSSSYGKAKATALEVAIDNHLCVHCFLCILNLV